MAALSSTAIACCSIKRGHEPLKGEWSLPGGVVELGETLGEALCREIREETGLDVTVGPVVEILDRVQRTLEGRVEYHFVIIDYLCRVDGGSLACATDADEAQWVAVADLDGFRPTASVRAVVRKAMELSK